MRVLHLLKTSEGAKWAYRQMRELVQLGIEVHVALPHGGSLYPDYSMAGIISHNFQFDFSLFKMWNRMRHLRNLVNRIKPDIIHSHFVGTTLTMRLALGRMHPVPRIFHVPGPLHLEYPFFRFAEILVAGPFDYWIGSCKATLKFYQRSKVNVERLFLSYYGTDVDTFVQKEADYLRKNILVPNKVAIVGMVAFMYPPKHYLGQTRGLKGHEDLIDALKLCIERGFDVVGVFVGGAWDNAVNYEAAVRRYAAKQLGERAVFLGTRHDVPLLYPGFDIAVHPSHSENVGGAVESLLLSVPTITTNVGGFPDVIVPDQTGWIVPPRDPEGLANAICDALTRTEAAKRMALNGRSHVRNLFDVKRTAKEIHAIYKHILSKKF